MSFFAAVPGPRAFRRMPHPRWFGAPDNWLPGMSAAALVLGKSDDTVITASKMACYPTGFEFELAMVGRGNDDDLPPGMPIAHHPRGGLLIGLRYADGAEGRLGWPGMSRGTRGGITLLPGGGSGDDRTYRMNVWVTPLPPEGPVTFIAACPPRGVAESAVTLDASALLEAGERAVQLWPDEPESDPEVDFSDAPSLPVPGVVPADAAESEQAIRAAYAQAFNNSPDHPTDPLSAVQDGAAFSGALELLRDRFPIEAATSRVAVGQVVFLDDVRAALTFRIVWTGAMGFGAQLGYAVRERGVWKVARDTYCVILGWAGIQPPPAPPAG